jgi:SAM-dependent methyltransferase
MRGKELEHEAATRLARLAHVFDLTALGARTGGCADIVTYYRRSAPAYKALHSKQGALHMALNPDGAFDEAGYLAQPEYVRRSIPDTATEVLELGAGNGFNLAYLATRRPNARFTGIDLVPEHIEAAHTRIAGAKLVNATAVCADFHALPFGRASFDVLFSIESLCHATTISVVLDEVARVLRPAGHLVVFDAWRTADFAACGKCIQQAAALVEHAMSVRTGRRLPEWLAAVTAAGLDVVEDVDLTRAILPNLYRFEQMAERYLAHPRMARVSARILAPELLANVIAGYLMPLTTASGAHTYRSLVCRPKPVSRAVPRR